MMTSETIIVLAIFFAFILAEIIFTHFFSKPGQKPSDGWVEGFSTLALTLFTQPKIYLAVYILGDMFFADYKGALSHIPFWGGFLLFIFFDDLVQYSWHRLSHSTPWLYKLHRPHHNASYMSIRLVYRNNFFYYALMPNIWFGAALVYMGLGPVFAVYLILKMLIIFGAHCDLAWDRKLYQIPALSPLMWVVERTISTPSTHFAHHGRHAADGITHYKGNYGNMLFLWDVIFGTAKITRQYPKEYGVEDLPDTTLGEQILWPLIRAKTDELAPDNAGSQNS